MRRRVTEKHDISRVTHAADRNVGEERNKLIQIWKKEFYDTFPNRYHCIRNCTALML